MLMRRFRNAFIITLCALGLAISCKDSGSEQEDANDSPRIVKSTQLISPKTNTSFTIGDTIHFELSSNGTAIDSVLLEYSDKTVTFHSSQFDWSIKNAKTGKQKIKVRPYCGGASEVHYLNLEFLSDIEPLLLTYNIIRVLPHDTDAYTQGLFFKDDTLIESTGQRGESRISKINLESAEVYKSRDLENQYFGEGSCYWNNQYFQITWTRQTGFVYDNNFNLLKTFSYPHQGWGITNWGDTLFVSDGTNTIHKIDPRDFTEIGKLEVYNKEEKVEDLNELELIDGLIYANIYQEDYIAVIDPSTGKVLKMIDMAGLLTPLEARKVDVLNGIAYHAKTKSTYVTGKLWPKLFEVQFTPKN